MKDFGLKDNELKQICSILQDYPAVKEAAIFGSRAKGTFRSGSDVDLSLKGSHLTYETIVRISYVLNEETLMPYHFDVVHYEQIQSPELKSHIDRVGKAVYQA